MQTRLSQIDQDLVHFNRTTMRVLIMAGTLALLTLIASTSSAQEVMSAGNLVLKATHIKTGAPISFGEGEFPEAVAPTILDCPGAKKSTCTLHIELVTQFSNITPGMVAGAALLINDVPTGVEPSNIVGFDSTSTGSASNTSTFTWVKEDLPKAWHKVQVFLFLSNISGTEPGFAGSFSRTLTIGVFKP
jgi:hypothetical protein